MARSDVFILSSIYEGFGNVVIEAMALGKPVILTKTEGGHIEISSSRYAIECEFNEKALAKAILKLYEDKELYTKYSNLSKERSKEFNIGKIAKRYLEVLSLNH